MRRYGVGVRGPAGFDFSGRRERRRTPRGPRPTLGAPLRVGLLNNMPDAALRATERQFAGLLRAAAGGREVRLELFSLASVERGATTRARMARTYRDARDLPDAGLDALIVTGAEPVAPRLNAEPYWDELAAVIDWTERTRIPTLWSCLAAHAAMLRLKGVERRALPAKLSGVYAGRRVDGHGLLDGAVEPLLIPHSRRNDLAEADLIGAGCRVVARSAAGVDVFTRGDAATSVFLQGHLEYEADTLLREYLRDVERWLTGARPDAPGCPLGCFDTETEAAFAALTEEAQSDPRRSRLGGFQAVAAGVRVEPRWRPTAVTLFRNWLERVDAGARPPAHPRPTIGEPPAVITTPS